MQNEIDSPVLPKIELIFRKNGDTDQTTIEPHLR